MSMTEYDIKNIDSIVAGEGDWFNAQLLRLMAKADKDNLGRLGQGFPEEFAHFCTWRSGGVPTYYAKIDEIRHFVNQSDFEWQTPSGGHVQLMVLTTVIAMSGGRDF